jgi:DNA invertase Pin-like site-specific DNA recombinase
MKKFYAYIRVSTLKQGEKGVSLQEQHAAIVRYAERQGLEVAQWFEERVTAAKQGRPLFAQMMKALRHGKAAGVIIYKIDRGARNLRDWAEIGELIDAGVAVHFANESLDLHSRGGRLSADIQAVVAADYVRNLREETIKGLYGRLKQGIYPFRAPLGYLDKGGGQVKAVDPMSAPLIREAFRLYASGSHTLESLLQHLHVQGLRNRKGGALSLNGLSTILRNSFYVGLMPVRNETYAGRHDPLIAPSLFRDVQARLAGRFRSHGWTHEFTLRSLFHCDICGRVLVGEIKKGRYRYYRCHTKGCATGMIREERLEAAMCASWPRLPYAGQPRAIVVAAIDQLLREGMGALEGERARTAMQLGAVTTRMARLVDALLDGAIDKDVFELRKAPLLAEKAVLEQKLLTGPPSVPDVANAVADIMEMAADASVSYYSVTPERRREFATTLCSHRRVHGKNVLVEPVSLLSMFAQRLADESSDLNRGATRTDADDAKLLWEWADRESKARAQETDIVLPPSRPYSTRRAA